MAEELFRGLPKVVAPQGTKQGEEELPEELRGLSQAELFKRLQAAHITEMANQSEEYTHKLEQLALTPPAPEPRVPAGPLQPAPVQEEPEFDLSNPQEYLNRAVDKRVAPLVASVVQSGREASRELLQSKMTPEEWEKYGPEIEQFVDQLSPQMQIQPKMYKVALNFVKSQHLDDIVTERTQSSIQEAVKKVLVEMGIEDADERLRVHEESTRKPVQRSLFASRGVPSTSAPRAASAANSGPAKGRLTREQRQYAEMFNMSEEEYLKYAEMNTDLESSLSRRERE